jgi:hypothetical protein
MPVQLIWATNLEPESVEESLNGKGVMLWPMDKKAGSPNLEAEPWGGFYVQLSPRGTLNVSLASLGFAHDALEWIIKNLAPHQGKLKLKFKDCNIFTQEIVEIQVTKLLVGILKCIDEIEGDRKMLGEVTAQLFSELLFSHEFGWALFAWMLNLETVEPLLPFIKAVKPCLALSLCLGDYVQEELDESAVEELLDFANRLKFNKDLVNRAFKLYREVLLCGFRYALFKLWGDRSQAS